MSENKKNLLLSNDSNGFMHRLYESGDTQNKDNKYIFTGCFTQCSSKKPGGRIIVNRNQRIYFDDEVLRHLGYLRDQIKENGFLAGELDHPDRFEVKLAESSHKITDLWYDEPTQRIMGRLELLDTPKGMIARQLVDAGLKLAVSSRSAGNVNPDKSVDIDMIYTYDIVFTPGFEEAHLQRVNEMKQNPNISEEARNYLNEMIERGGNYSIDSLSKKAQKLYEESQKFIENNTVPLAELCKPLDESHLVKEENMKNDEEKESKEEEITLPEANLNPLAEDDDKEESKDENSKEEKKDDSKDENKEESKEEKKDLSDEDKKERRSKILKFDVKKKGEEDKPSEDEAAEKRDKIIGIEAETKDEDDSEESANESEENSEEENCKDCKDGKCKECGDKNEDKKDADFDKKVLNDCDKMCAKVKKETENDMSKVQDLLNKVKKQNEVREQIYRVYPFSVSLSEKAFGQFAALSAGEKNKVQKFIVQNQIYTVKEINESWQTPLITEKRIKKNWLRLASEEDRRLFALASIEEQNAIEESASYVVIETREDAERFWAKTGLRTREAQRLMNESLSQRYTIQQAKDIEKVNADDEACKKLGYNMNVFKFLEDNF